MSENIKNSTITYFASVERLSKDLILVQAKAIEESLKFYNSFNLTPHSMLVLNKERQIIYSNDVLHKMLELEDSNEALGLRPGEVLECVNAINAPGGCGTSNCCSLCGAINAILECEATNSAVTKECHITTNLKNNNMFLDLQIYATPLTINTEAFIVFVLINIGEKKRKELMEKVFLHDVLNTFSASKGLIDLIKNIESLEEAKTLSQYASESLEMLLEEVTAQRDLILAEKDELSVNLSKFSAMQLIESLVRQYVNNEETICKVEVVYPSEQIYVISDLILVRRVLTNMLKNAVEASNSEDTVKIGILSEMGNIDFWVSNNQYIPMDAQQHIFKSHYSSKDTTRGYGTYSMKLLGEKYLGGSVFYTSSEAQGTKFYFRLKMIK